MQKSTTSGKGSSTNWRAVYGAVALNTIAVILLLWSFSRFFSA